MRGSRLKSHVITWLQKLKIQIKIQVFVSQDSRTTKLKREETYNETRCNQVMLTTQQKFNASGTF